MPLGYTAWIFQTYDYERWLNMNQRTCPNCDDDMPMKQEVHSNIRGRVWFRSWACPGCASHVATRRIGREPEETLLTSPHRTRAAKAGLTSGPGGLGLICTRTSLFYTFFW